MSTLSPGGVLSPIWSNQRFFDNNGLPLNGGQIFTYVAGSSTVGQATYSDYMVSVPNSNPIVLDSSGQCTTEIWLPAGKYYHFVLKDSNNNIIASADFISGASVFNGVIGANIATASTVNLNSATGNYVTLTGTNTISTFTLTSGQQIWTQFDSSAQIVNSSSIILPNGNITTSAGDTALWQGLPGGVVKLIGGSLFVKSISSNNIVSSIANLRTVSHGVITTIFVEGYYSTGDGGGGEYYYDPSDTTSADNGGTIIVANDNARWKLIVVDGTVSIRQFGAKPDAVTDNTTSITNAVASGYKTLIPAGTYVCQNVPLVSGTELFGIGQSSILLQPSSATSNNFVIQVGAFSATTPIANNVTNLYLHDFQVQGRVVAEGFSQFVHLIHLSGVTDVRLNRLTISGFKGDGLYIGSGVMGNELHNLNVLVEDCLIDGVNNNNRNGISIIDCNYITIRNNRIINCTNSTMPGAIDFEPDSSFNVIKNYTVENNSFYNVGGNVGVISIEIAPTIPIPQFGKITKNIFQNSQNGAGHGEIDININRLTDDTSPMMGLEIGDNYFLGTALANVIPLRLFSGNGIKIHNNTFKTYAPGILLGYTGATNKPRYVDFYKNVLQNVGSQTISPVATNVLAIDFLNIFENNFIDSGYSGGGLAIQFTGSVTSSYVNIQNNIFSSGSSFTTTAISVAGGHTLTPSTNTQLNNIILNNINLGNFFAYKNNPWVSADNGDANASLTWGLVPTTQIWNTPLTTNRTVTFNLNGEIPVGSKFKIVRQSGATGGFTLTVGSKTLAVSQWIDVEFNTSGQWIETGFGSL